MALPNPHGRERAGIPPLAAESCSDRRAGSGAERPSIDIGSAAKLLGITYAAASANVKKLVDAGILAEVTGKKRDQLFVARQILAVAEGS